jgi:predicted O-methyltransferase YrrM
MGPIKQLMNVKIVGSVLIPLASSRLKAEERNCATIEDFEKFAASWQFLKLLTIKPDQIREEILQLLAQVAELQPKVMLEIGTAVGGTIYLFSKVIPSNGVIISLDLPGGPFGGGYPDWKIPLYKSFARCNQKIHLIRCNSHDALSLLKIQEVTGGHAIDFLFIDGDHSYEGVKQDFQMYAPLVRKGGIIAFHDIVPGPERFVGGVPRFWSEIKKQHKYQELVKSWGQKGFGIGVLFV